MPWRPRQSLCAMPRPGQRRDGDRFKIKLRVGRPLTLAWGRRGGDLNTSCQTRGVNTRVTVASSPTPRAACSGGCLPAGGAATHALGEARATHGSGSRWAPRGDNTTTDDHSSLNVYKILTIKNIEIILFLFECDHPLRLVTLVASRADSKRRAAALKVT